MGGLAFVTGAGAFGALCAEGVAAETRGSVDGGPWRHGECSGGGQRAAMSGRHLHIAPVFEVSSQGPFVVLSDPLDIKKTKEQMLFS